MPTYEYECADCGVFDARRSIAERDLPATCPGCDARAARVMRSAPQLGSLPGAGLGIGERAANESARYSAHGGGCGCCGPKVSLPRG